MFNIHAILGTKQSIDRVNLLDMSQISQIVAYTFKSSKSILLKTLSLIHFQPISLQHTRL